MTYLQEVCCGNNNHQCISKLFNLLLQALAFIPSADAGAALQGMAHEHAVVCKELASLGHIVVAAA